MDSVGLERFRFQSCLNKAGYLETLEQKSLMDMDLAKEDEDITNLEICKLRDGSDLRISDNLDDLNETKGDDLELGRLLGIDEFKVEMILEIDAGIFVFSNSNYVQGLIDCKKIINSRGYNILRVLLIKFLERDAITITGHNFLLIITSWNNNLYFRLLKAGELEDAVKRRLELQRSKTVKELMSLLVSHRGEKVWGEKRVGSKVEMVAQIVGFRPKINTGRDTSCMDVYLNRVSRSGLDMPTMMTQEQFLPAGAPLLDFLAYDTRKPEGWKYPKAENLEYYQNNRGLSLEMLKEIEVRELVCGVSSEKEIDEIREWIKEMHEKDQGSFSSQVVSLDVEDVKVTY